MFEINTERIFINNVDIAEYGAKALRNSIKIGGTDIDNDYFQGRNRTHYTLMSTTYGLKSVGFTLVFIDRSLRRALAQKSKCEASMFNGCDIYMPDGFYYRCMIDKIGNADITGVDGSQVLIECDYDFKGIQHDKIEVVQDGTKFYAKGTMPTMDCILEVTVGANANSYSLGGATFGAVNAGDVLVFDGINKRFLKNGAPTTATNWIKFPQVVSGLNRFTALDTVKVTYYPCYI
jgi:hypothetical protein